MLILPLALAMGALIGWAVGGSWRPLAETHFRHSSFLLCAITAQVALELPGLRGWPSGLRSAIIVVSYLVVGWWLFENARTSTGGERIGLCVVACGGFLNFLAIALNGGMPVSKSALARAGIAPSASVIQGHLSKHVLANRDTLFRVLGDVIPLAWFRSVVSPGDMLMAVGIGIVIASAMKRPISPGNLVARLSNGPEGLAALTEQ